MILLASIRILYTLRTLLLLLQVRRIRGILIVQIGPRLPLPLLLLKLLLLLLLCIGVAVA